MQLSNLTGRVGGLITRRAVDFNFSSHKKLLFFMESKTRMSGYEEAVYALNGLQSNSVVIQKAREERSAKAYINLTDTEKHLSTLGIKVEDLDSLNVIHVAGTKGKGSTCAFTESILRKHGIKTGFYSSPHLKSVNERIRINGTPITEESFVKYFWEVYDGIHLSLKEGESMPPYFLFLTVMAFYVFVKEKVGAAVIEVGIGGLWDCTNIVRKPVAVGISTLGIDHVNILGNTITEIAEQKAGIFKPNVPSFTVPQQEAAMKALRVKADSVGCQLLLSPPVEAYEDKIALGVQGIVQNVNASLALQLTHTWLKQRKYHDQPESSQNGDRSIGNTDALDFPLPMANTFPINSNLLNALQTCVWPGRFQSLEKGKITFYLDGAHTRQSMEYCVKWFQDHSQIHRSKHNLPILKVLLFNCTGERRAETLLDPLTDVNFDLVMFCPNRINIMKDATSDLSNFMVEPEKEIQQVVANKEIWHHLMRSMYENELSATSSNNNTHLPEMRTATASDNAFQFSSISNALSFISSSKISEKDEPIRCDDDNSFLELVRKANHIQVLVTGSLHLVGGVLSLIDP